MRNKKAAMISKLFLLFWVQYPFSGHLLRCSLAQPRLGCGAGQVGVRRNPHILGIFRAGEADLRPCRCSGMGWDGMGSLAPKKRRRDLG